MVIALTGSEVKVLSTKECGLAAPFSRDEVTRQCVEPRALPPVKKPLADGCRLPSLIRPVPVSEWQQTQPGALADRKGWSLGDGLQLSGLGANMLSIQFDIH